MQRTWLEKETKDFTESLDTNWQRTEILNRSTDGKCSQLDILRIMWGNRGIAEVTV